MSVDLMEATIDEENLGLDYVRKINCQENQKQTEYSDYYMLRFKTNLYIEQLE